MQEVKLSPLANDIFLHIEYLKENIHAQKNIVNKKVHQNHRIQIIIINKLYLYTLTMNKPKIDLKQFHY